EFSARARKRVVSLQAGDPETLRIWQGLIELSKAYFNRVYSTLDVTLTDADLAGESMYNDMLEEVCRELEDKGLAVSSEGALCVFLDEIGRASCRERVEISVVAVSLKKKRQWMKRGKKVNGSTRRRDKRE